MPNLKIIKINWASRDTAGVWARQLHSYTNFGTTKDAIHNRPQMIRSEKNL